ncbi:hypothetical protein MBLNU13_g10947t1 [Cladosporium sp. NU13]
MADPTNLHLPSTRALLTSLITTLATSTYHSSGSSNPLSDASENTKSALLTLHTLFPTDLLPALDLLDRGLVTRLVLASASDAEQQAVDPITERESQKQNQDSPTRKRRPTVAYYVRTAQQQKSFSRSSRPHNIAAATVQGATSYEVHLTAWNCSCPAFAFAAFPADSPCQESDESASMRDEGAGWRFGGLTRGDSVPACKHLLACVIAEHCGGFEALVEEREVGAGEVAGWAAGWGD